MRQFKKGDKMQLASEEQAVNSYQKLTYFNLQKNCQQLRKANMSCMCV